MSESLRFVLLDERSLLYVRQFLTATPRAGSSAIMSFLGLDHRNQAAEITPRHLREKPRLAVIATVCEVGLCVAMFFGLKTRWASAGSAILLFMFATSMMISGLSQFHWAVYVLTAGAFMLATVDATLLSIDSIVLTKKESWNSPVATH